ncbi:MAG: thiamine-phosphate kinase [Aridibacter sp.]
MQSEFEFINNLKNRYGLNKIGDDAAVLSKDSKTDLVISADMLVEEIDFRLDWSKPFYIGSKCLTVSISDIFAMGAKPTFSLISIGIPPQLWDTDFVDEFYKGYFSIANKYNVELVGGDVSKTPDKLVFDSIVMGEVAKGKAILRSTAKVGDLIFVMGELGGASAGLKILENGIRYDNSAKSWQRRLFQKQLHPFPKNSKNLTEFATSMIDLSDGLSSDLNHICKASKVGAKIYADKIPIHTKLRHLSNENIKKFLSENLDILDFVLHGGEDFELLFTIRPSDLKKFEKKISGNITHIGEITGDTENIEIIRDGKSEILQPKGYQHF